MSNDASADNALATYNQDRFVPPTRFYLVPSILLAIAIGIQAAALPLSYWLADEFDTALRFRIEGFGWMLSRMSTWSPRPISEFILYAYMSIVNVVDRPFVTEFNTALWIAAAAALAIGVYACPRDYRWQAALLAATVMIVPSIGPNNSEPYFWAQAALAYLPTFTAMTLVVLVALLFDLDRLRTWSCLSVLLTIACLSSEVGMMVAFCASGCLVLLIALGPADRRKTKMAFILVPLAISVIVLISLIQGRVSLAVELFGDPAVAGDLRSSFGSAIMAFFAEAGRLSSNRPMAPGLGLGYLVLLLVGAFVYGAFHTAADRRRALLLSAIGLAIGAASFGSMFSAYYQFGLVCCDRHGVFRQIGALLTSAAFAGAAACFVPSKRAGRWPAAPLTAALALVFLAGLPSTIEDLQRMEEITSTRIANWNSGLSEGETMEWIAPRPGRSITGNSPGFPAGNFNVDEATGTPRYAMEYFGKRSITIRRNDEW